MRKTIQIVTGIFLVMGAVFLFAPLSPLFAQVYFGNQSMYSGLGTLAMSGTTYQESIRFTMPSNNAVSLISIPGNITGVCPNIQFGIQADNGSGFPSNTYLCASAVTAFSNTAQGWDTAPVSPAIALTAGVTYHIVVEYPGGTGSGTASNNWTLDSGNTPYDLIIPFNDTVDPAMMLENGGPSWVDQTGYKMVYALTFTDGTSYGNPYDSGDLTNTVVYGTNVVAENFQVTGGSNIVINDIEVNASKVGGGTAADSLYGVLVDLSIPATVAAVTLTSPAGWVSQGLASQVTLNTTDSYRLYFNSPLSA